MAAIQLRRESRDHVTVGMAAMDVGFYGKLPSHGDFLRRRVSDGFVARWDLWLQECMSASQAALGEQWLDVYLTSPAWRFVCGGGACGAAPVIGVLAPSVDRVGRYFPMTIIAELPADIPAATAATRLQPFFDAAEQLLIDTLATEEVNFDRFDTRVASLRDELPVFALPRQVVLESAAVAVMNGDAAGSWHIPIDSSGLLAPIFEQLLSLQLSSIYDPLVVWWTEGSSNVEPSCLIGSGLPAPASFSALLDGSWAEHRWRSAPAQVDRPPVEESEALDQSGAVLRFRSAAATDVGCARANNQDAFVERPEIGLWVVADGLGGHRDGEIASREVCDALADMMPSPSFDDTVDAACERMQQVNEHLLRGAGRSVLTDRAGSTVVALIVRDSRCAIVWAGDSRVYRWRTGRLERLTEDHSLEEANPVTGRQEGHAITRAIGVASTLTLDVHRDVVRPGDRFLLCSDGLTRIVTEAQIGQWMEGPDLRAIVEGLIRTTLDGGAPDNVTVLIAEAYT